MIKLPLSTTNPSGLIALVHPACLLRTFCERMPYATKKVEEKPFEQSSSRSGGWLDEKRTTSQVV
ncbi:hypothetical protein ZHAS_00014603 [Anopheles sinensis]|uniref:Uncharacterized protein n=1 Tax=Anopheles sinensis TaxID=74873 RepID=A0A084W8M2_ANOSI|nr:hypothetical protein ZHAS_00014603 [Anopheles sinensis]